VQTLGERDNDFFSQTLTEKIMPGLFNHVQKGKSITKLSKPDLIWYIPAPFI